MRVKAFVASCLMLLFAAVCALPGDPARAQGSRPPTPQAAASPRSKQVIIERGSDNQRGSHMTITSDAALNHLRNWAAELVAGGLLAGLGLFAASRRTRAAAAPPPAALHMSSVVKLDEARGSTPEVAAPTVVNGEVDATGGDMGGETVAGVAAALAPVASSVTAAEVGASEPRAQAPAEVSDEAAPPAAEPPVSESAASQGKGGAASDGDASLAAALRGRLASREPSERAAALAELARFDVGEAFRQICAAFDDESGDVRAAAARALYEMQGDRADSFTRALRESTDSRRRHIGEAIASSGLASDAISQLTSESREQTYEAFSLLFLMAKAGEVTPLVRAVEDPLSNEVRLAVVKLLALSGQKEVLPAFRRLAVRGSLPPEVRTAVMEAIYQIGSRTGTT